MKIRHWIAIAGFVTAYCIVGTWDYEDALVADAYYKQLAEVSK